MSMKQYVNGKVYVEKGQFAQAFAVADGKIVQVGTDEEISRLEGEVVDLKGKTVLPGLNDSHMHLLAMGEALSKLKLNGAKSIDEIVARGREFLANQEADITFLHAIGWNQDYFVNGEKRLINRYDLDRISTEIPIVADRVCCHVVSCNSKALELLNIQSDTHVAGGEIHRDAKGEPTGIFAENASVLLKKIIPIDQKEDIQRYFLAAVDYALKHGLTTVQSCDIHMKEDWRMVFQAIKELYDGGKVPLRYYIQASYNDMQTLKEYIEEVYERDFYNDLFQKGALKLFKDGSLGGRTALMTNPYHDDPSTTGIETLSNAEMDEICALADAKGIRVITHAIGDEAVKRCVDSYVKVSHGDNPLRHGIVHCQITDLPTLERIAKNHIYVSYQPIFLDYDTMIVRERVGDALASTSYAHNTLYNKLGAHTAYGTDAPIEDLNPFRCIYCAVTRQRMDGEPKGGLYPEERVSVEDAIDCYTIESAYGEGLEGKKGRIKEGYFADFIVLDRDIFTIEPADIKNIKVECTYINGVCVYKQ
jgi:predicted amidohydrolase YtcJ